MIKTNEQKLKLARKYFLQQKAIEIILVILILSAIIFIPYSLGKNIGDGKYCRNYEKFIIDINECSHNEILTQGKISTWFEGAGYIFISSIAIAGICLIVYLILGIIFIWLESNWVKAKKRAGLK